MSEIIEKLNWRYATKSFDENKRIKKEDLETIKEAFRLTPSSFWLQPWKLVILENQELKNKLVEHSWGQEQVANCSELVVFTRPSDFWDKNIEDFLDDIVSTRWVTRSDLEWYENMMKWFLSNMSLEQKDIWAIKQVYIALWNLISTCAQLDIDSCPIEWFISEKYDEILWLKEKWLTSVVVLPIWYRSNDDKYSELKKVRFKQKEVIETIK